MDNKLVVGVGNIYASESLFSAGIHPDRLASSLSREECEQLVKVIKLVLLRSIEQGGTTLEGFPAKRWQAGLFCPGAAGPMAARANRAGSAARRLSGPNMPSGRPFIAVSARSSSQEQERFVGQVSVAPPAQRPGQSRCGWAAQCSASLRGSCPSR